MASGQAVESQIEVANFANSGEVFDTQPVIEVVLQTRLGPENAYHKPVTKGKFLDMVGQRVGLVVKDGKVIPVVVGLDQAMVIENALGRGVRGNVPDAAEQKAITEICQLNNAQLEIGFKTAIAEKVLALEAMADKLPGRLKDFKLDPKTRRRLKGDARRAGLIPVNQSILDLAAMDLEPVAGTGVHLAENPIDVILDKVSSKLARWLPSQKKMVGLAAPTGLRNDDLSVDLAPAGGSNRVSFPVRTGDERFDQQMRTVKNVVIVSAVVAGLGLLLAACGPKIISAIDGTPVDVDPTDVYLPTEQPSATPDIGLVGVASPTPEIGVTATPEIGQPTVWQPPTAEQARAGTGGSFPEGYEQVVDAMRAIVLEQVPGAKEAGAAWNNGLGDNFHSIFWAKAASGNFLWKTGVDQAFDEYPMHWNEYQSGLTPGQEFSEIPDSKSAVVGFTGPSAGGLGEKPVLMKTVVTLADGQTQAFLEYFDFQTGEWRTNPNIELAMLPEITSWVTSNNFELNGTVLMNDGTELGNIIKTQDGQYLFQGVDQAGQQFEVALDKVVHEVPKADEASLWWNEGLNNLVWALDIEKNDIVEFRDGQWQYLGMSMDMPETQAEIVPAIENAVRVSSPEQVRTFLENNRQFWLDKLQIMPPRWPMVPLDLGLDYNMIKWYNINESLDTEPAGIFKLESEFSADNTQWTMDLFLLPQAVFMTDLYEAKPGDPARLEFLLTAKISDQFISRQDGNKVEKLGLPRFKLENEIWRLIDPQGYKGLEMVTELTNINNNMESRNMHPEIWFLTHQELINRVYLPDWTTFHNERSYNDELLIRKLFDPVYLIYWTGQGGD